MPDYKILYKTHVKKSKISGNELTGLCPFHDDRNPSFSANLETGLFKCFACNKSGNAYQFAEAVGDTTFLNNNGNSNMRKFSPAKSKFYTKPKWNPGQNDLPDKILKWFENRGISNSVLVKNDIQCKTVWMPQRKQKVKAIAFPYYDLEGNVFNVKYRDLKKNFTQVKGARPGFYGLKTFPQGEDTCIVTEGEADSISLDSAGFTNNVSVPNGANGLKFLEHQKNFLNQIETIIIAVDNDKAGQELQKKLINKLSDKDLWITNITNLKT